MRINADPSVTEQIDPRSPSPAENIAFPPASESCQNPNNTSAVHLPSIHQR